MATALRRNDIRVTGRDEVHRAMLSSYNVVASLEPTPGAPAESLTFAARAAWSDHLSVDRFHLGGSGAADANRMRHGRQSAPNRAGAGELALAACVVRTGLLRFDTGGDEAARFGPGDVHLYPDGGFQVAWAEVTADLVRVPMPLVRKHAQELIGPPAGRVRFRSMEPMTAAAARPRRGRRARVPPRPGLDRRAPHRTGHTGRRHRRGRHHRPRPGRRLRRPLRHRRRRLPVVGAAGRGPRGVAVIPGAAHGIRVVGPGTGPDDGRVPVAVAYEREGDLWSAHH